MGEKTNKQTNKKTNKTKQKKPSIGPKCLNIGLEKMKMQNLVSIVLFFLIAIENRK